MIRVRFRSVWIIAAILAALVGAFLLLRGRSEQEEVLASLQLPDGSEYTLTQARNREQSPFSLDFIRYSSSPISKHRWTYAPYRVSFHMRPAGGTWGWCYIDHRARYWRDASMTYDPTTDVITIMEGGKWRASLDRKRSAFAIGDGKPYREVPAPQLP